MEHHLLERAVRGLRKQGLFECAYFNGTQASYALYDPSGFVDIEEVRDTPIWHRTIDIRDGEILFTDAHPCLSADDDLSALKTAIELRYTANFIRTDVLEELFIMLRSGAEALHSAKQFGQAVYYADLDEVRFKDGECWYDITRRAYYVTTGSHSKMVEVA